jgi:hypothetical protein
MMKARLIIILLIVWNYLPAQLNEGWVDAQAMRIPDSVTQDVNVFAGYLQSTFALPEEKVRAAYHWICTNIRYRVDSMYLSNWGDHPEYRVNATLRRRSGLCDHYAGLMAMLLSKCGLQAVVVNGYTRGGNGIDFTGHSWVAVLAGPQWKLCDPTWDVGATDYHYYLISPENFIDTHFPFDPLWQLLPEPVTFAGFGKPGNKNNHHRLPVDVNAAVATHLQLDTLAQFNAAAQRMLAAGFVNDKHKTWYDYSRMKTAIVTEENEIGNYNISAAHYNRAVKFYNLLQQTNGTDKVKILALQDSCYKALADADKKAAIINKALLENYNYDVEGLQKQIAKLRQRLRDWVSARH